MALMVTRTRGGRFGIHGPLHLMRNDYATMCGLSLGGSTLQRPRESRMNDENLRHCGKCVRVVEGLKAADGWAWGDW